MSRATPIPDSPREHSRAFSLVELLLVIAVLALAASLIAPAFSSLLQSSEITRGGQALADEINHARQLAAAKNRVVQLRLIRVEDGSGFNAVQIWATDPDGSMRPQNKAAVLPQSALISDRPNVSGAIAALDTGTMPPDAAALSGREYVSFQIRPNGVVVPSMPMQNLFFTIITERNAQNNALPDNYVTVQMNPLSGTALVYRP